MPLTTEELEDIRNTHMADDIPIEFATMAAWSREEAEAYFESGGTVQPGAPAALSGLHTLSGKLMDGTTLEYSSLVGKPVIMLNVASR